MCTETSPILTVRTRRMAAKGQMTPDEIEEEVLSEIPRLSAAQLEAACGAVSLAVLEASKGDKKALRKQLTNYLDTDDKETEFRKLHDLLFPDTDDKDEKLADADQVDGGGNSGIKTEPVDTNKTKKVTLKKTERTKKSEPSSNNTMPSEDVTVVNRTLRKDFKLSGMVGGSSENALTYASLEFEIKKGRKSGHSEEEICTAVISKVADKELRSYFETEVR